VGTGEIVAEVRVRGNRRIEASAIRARIGTRPGEPYRIGQVAEDVKQVYALSFFRNVRVLTDRDARGLIVIFEVEENPVVRQISISGNENIDSDKIKDVLTLTTGTTLDYPLLFENRVRIQTLYRAQGYYLAEVSHEIETLSEASVGIHFIVDENEKLKLRKIDFVGNEHFSDRELREDFRTKPWRFWSYLTTYLDKSGTYSEPLFVQDLRGVEKKYTDAGFLQLQMDGPQVAASPEGIDVTVRIQEGPQFRVGEIQISGDETADIPALRELLELHEGEIFNRSLLTEDVSRLRDHYTDRGFFYATVEPQSDLHEQTRIVDVNYNVRKGPLYFIRQIDISGNTTTVDPVIRREVPLVEGQLYSQRKMALAQARIRRLGFFEEVDLQVEPTPEPEQLDLEVSVVEKPTGSFSFGAGFSSQDSFLLNGSLSQNNLFGRGWAVALNADVGRETQRFFFSLRDPAFLGSNFSLGMTVFSTRLRFEDFDQDATGVELNAGHALSEDGRSNGFARYNFSSRSVDQNTFASAASMILREIFQQDVTTSLVGLSYTSDHRDDLLSPKEGYLVTGALEFAGLGFFSKFLRFEARAEKFIPAPRWLFEESTFKIAGRIGWTAPFNSIGDFEFPACPGCPPAQGFAGQVQPLDAIDTDLTLPLTERYFLGGIGRYQLRGFKARSVGPRRPILQQVPIFNVGGEIVGTAFTPLGRATSPAGGLETGECSRGDETLCNLIGQTDDFNVPEETDVIGGNKFISLSLEYRFPILESFGLQGIAFFDTGNAFAEDDPLYDPRDWRYGAGGAVQWFSPFGPIMLVLGFPLDRIAELEDSPVFEFSVGGG
jgi:outer membrane protein insertion porin family